MNRSQRLLASFFAFAGAMHFVIPRSYAAHPAPGAVGAAAAAATDDALGLARDPRLRA
jgi:hypothetical protein